MNKIEKLLKKISKKDREALLLLIEKITKEYPDLEPVKIKNTDFLRVRHGKFRIIFHKEDGTIIIDSIRIRSESTYENL